MHDNHMPPLPDGVPPAEPPDHDPTHVEVGPDQMLIYQVNEDDSIGIMRWWKKDPLPEGWKPYTKWYEDKGTIYYDNGKFTQHVKTPEEMGAEIQQEDMIQQKMRAQAIRELKTEGKLPRDFKEK